MKRTSALLLAAMTFSTVAAMAENPFTDVPASHWAYDAIVDLGAKGILMGYPDGSYKGENTVNRYQLALIVAKALARVEQELGEGNNPFSNEDLKTLEKLTVEFADELALIGVKVVALEDELKAIKEDVDGVKKDVADIKSKMANGVSGFDKISISGDMLVRHDDGLNGTVGQATNARLRLRVDAKIDDRIDAAVRTVLYADTYGSNLGGAAGASSNFDNLNSISNQNDVDIAYLNIKDVLNGNLKIGRDFYTHGSALVLNNCVDAIGYSIRSGKIDIALNAIYNNDRLENMGVGVAGRQDRQIWNINLDTILKGHELYLGYYNKDYAPDDKASVLEVGSKGNIDKNGKLSYEIGYVATDIDTNQLEGTMYHVALQYNSIKDWNIKLAYTAGDDEYTIDGLSVSHVERMTDGVESPLDDIAAMGYAGFNKMRDAKNFKIQAEYAPVNGKHSFRIAYDMYEQDANAARGTIAATAEDEANILTLEYRYQLAMNCRLRLGYQTLDGDKASKDTDDDRFYIELYSRF